MSSDPTSPQKLQGATLNPSWTLTEIEGSEEWYTQAWSFQKNKPTEENSIWHEQEAKRAWVPTPTLSLLWGPKSRCWLSPSVFWSSAPMLQLASELLSYLVQEKSHPFQGQGWEPMLEPCAYLSFLLRLQRLQQKGKSLEQRFSATGWQPLWGIKWPFHKNFISNILHIKYSHYDS